MSFASGFSAGLQLFQAQKQYEHDATIDAAGKAVQEEIQKEKDFKAQQEKAQQDLINNAKPVTQSKQDPGIYQKGDSLGLEGYQTGNKPVQTTVPTAPEGYMTRDQITPGYDTGGYYEPEPNIAANPSTEQTLIGNYGTTAAFKGEKPTEQDIKDMQTTPNQEYSYKEGTKKEVTIPGEAGAPAPFASPDQTSNLKDLAVNKPAETPAEMATPKPLEILNDKINDADLAKESYNYHRRVIQKLEQGGNPRAALEYGSKLASSELTLAQADQIKFNTTSGISKQVANLAANVLEDIQQPGADVNKLYFDFANRIKDQFGFTGKVPFSLDPRENIKYLDRFQKDALSVGEKSELNLKTANAQIEKNIKLTKLAMDQEDLTLKKMAEARMQGKENREEAQVIFNRYVERAKLLQTGLNALNEYQDEPTKKAYKTEMDATLAKLKSFEKDLGVKSSIDLNTLGLSTPSNTQVNKTGTANTTTQVQNAAPGAVETKVKPNDSTPGTYTVDLNKSVNKTAGGYDVTQETPKTPAQQKADNVATKKTSEEVKANDARIKMLTARLDRKALAKSAAQGTQMSEAEIAKKVGEKYTKDWESTKAFWGKVLGPDDEAAIKEIERLQNRNEELKAQ